MTESGNLQRNFGFFPFVEIERIKFLYFFFSGNIRILFFFFIHFFKL